LLCLPNRPLARDFLVPVVLPVVPPPPDVVEPLPVDPPPPVDPPLPVDPPPRLGSWVLGRGLLGRGLVGRGLVGSGFVGRGRGTVGTLTSSPPTLSELAVLAAITASVLPNAVMKMSLFAIPWRASET